MKPLRRLALVSLALAPVFAGCQPKEEMGPTSNPNPMPSQPSADDFRRSVPRQEMVTVVVPGSNGSGQGLTVESHAQAFTLASGDVADMYRLTRGASLTFNGAAVIVLGLVKAIVNLPPTSISENQAVWGPGSDALDPIVWRMTVTRAKTMSGEYEYSYALEGRDKQAPSAAFVTVLSGTHSPALDAQGRPIEGFGGGSFTLDNNKRNTLPLPERRPDGQLKDVGAAHYTYERKLPNAAVSIAAQFMQVRDEESGRLVDLGYRYGATPGNGGSMEFLHMAPRTLTMAGASWSIKSRWLDTGAGRTDVVGKGGDLPAGFSARLSECWDVTFASRYQRVNWDASFGWGTEATDCVFTSAEYSTL